MNGRKIDGHRILTDIERGRTRADWRPRRLGTFFMFKYSFLTPVWFFTIVYVHFQVRVLVSHVVARAIPNATIEDVMMIVIVIGIVIETAIVIVIGTAGDVEAGPGMIGADVVVSLSVLLCQYFRYVISITPQLFPFVYQVAEIRREVVIVRGIIAEEIKISIVRTIYLSTVSMARKSRRSITIIEFCCVLFILCVCVYTAHMKSCILSLLRPIFSEFVNIRVL